MRVCRAAQTRRSGTGRKVVGCTMEVVYRYVDGLETVVKLSNSSPCPLIGSMGRQEPRTSRVPTTIRIGCLN